MSSKHNISRQSPVVRVVRWENPPEGHQNRGRPSNPEYDAIAALLAARPGEFARLGEFRSQSKAITVQQSVKKRGCEVTSRRRVGVGDESSKTVVWARMPSKQALSLKVPLSAIGQDVVSKVEGTLEWGDPPNKFAGFTKR